MSVSAALLLAAGLAVGQVACRNGYEVSSESDGTATDVLLITVDTTRADRFSYTGLSPVETPNIDALAAEGTVFLQAVSPAPITLVAHASLFTGQLPMTHGVHNNGTYRLGPQATTMAELLSNAGYRTAAFIGAAVLGGRYGLDQGFENYDDKVYADRRYPERRAEEVVDEALAWLGAQQGGRTFVWVHLFDPHDPYEPPEPERSRYPDAPYDGEIAYVDRAIGKLLAGYRSRGRYRNGLVLLTSDHGESLGSHGEPTHGIFLYDDTVHVPLVIRGPGVGVGRRVEGQVQLIDLLPTLCSLLGVEPPPGAEGQDLAPVLLENRSPIPLPALLESFLPLEAYGWAALSGLRTEDWKLVEGVAAELYNLADDPREIRDLAGVEGERVDDLSRLLESRQATAPVQPIASRVELDETTRRQLAVLGYTTANEAIDRGGDAASTVRPDPRVQVHLLRARSSASELFARGFHPQAIDRLESILRQDPNNLMVKRLLAQFLVATGSFADAERLLADLVEANPADGHARRLLGVVAELRGDRDNAIEAYGAALQTATPSGDLRARRWELLMMEGRREEVEAEASEASIRQPGDGAAMAWVTISRWAGSDDRRLEAELRHQLLAQPEDPELLSALGGVLFELGDLEGALPPQREAFSHEPRSARYGTRLARTLRGLGRMSEVRAVLRGSGAMHQFDPQAWALLGEACQQLGDPVCEVASLCRLSVLAKEPELRPSSTWPILGELLRRGEAASQRGDLATVREALSAAAELVTGGMGTQGRVEDGDPDPPAARLRAAEAVGRIGSATWIRGQPWEALQAYLLGTILVPEDPRFFYNTGLAWARVGDFDEAQSAFREALRLNPDFTEAREHLQTVVDRRPT